MVNHPQAALRVTFAVPMDTTLPLPLPVTICCNIRSQDSADPCFSFSYKFRLAMETYLTVYQNLAVRTLPSFN